MAENETTRIKKIEDVLVKAGTEIARKKEGALFVVSDNSQYKRLRQQQIQPFSVFEEGAVKMLASLGAIDGAVIINRNGIVVEYGVMLRAKGVFPGFGTRHSAAYSASLNKDTTAVLVSEEEQTIKIFKKGKIINKIDIGEKLIEKPNQGRTILESVGFAALISIVASALAPNMFGSTTIPGLFIFGIPYFIFRVLLRRQKQMKRN